MEIASTTTFTESSKGVNLVKLTPVAKNRFVRFRWVFPCWERYHPLQIYTQRQQTVFEKIGFQLLRNRYAVSQTCYSWY